MFVDTLNDINAKIDKILSIHRSLPEWYPINMEVAKECGYKSLDGLRKWCYKNLPPDDFVKRGHLWYVNIRSLHSLKSKNLV